jgi:glycosyltransferase involved in cell wall biosynthesis
VRGAADSRILPVIPQLSVIIVAYRSRDEIGPCLNSLPRELDGREVEVIVVDNFAGQWRE